MLLYKKSKINKNIEIRRFDFINYFVDMDIVYYVISIMWVSEFKNVDFCVVICNSFFFFFIKFCIWSIFNYLICVLFNENVIV